MSNKPTQYTVPVALCMWDVHYVDMNLVEEGRRVIDSGWKPNFGGLADLALVTSLNVPFHVSVECRPPEAVKKDTAHGIKPLWWSWLWAS